MTDIKTLKDILHREQLKEDEKHVGIPSWNRQFNELATSLGHGDLSKSNHKKIADYKQALKLEREYSNSEKEIVFLKIARNTLIWLCLYPLAILISLFVIYNL